MIRGLVLAAAACGLATVSNAAVVYSTLNALPSTSGQGAAGHRSQPSTFSPPPANSVLWDDINVDDETVETPDAFLNNQPFLSMNSVTVLIVQQAMSPATTVSLSMARTIAGTGSGNPTLDLASATVIGSRPIGAWMTNVSRTIPVTFTFAPGSAVVQVNYADQNSTSNPDNQEFGQFALGLSFADVGDRNIWAIHNYNVGNDPELNLDLLYENSGSPISFGGTPFATMTVSIDGTPVPEPTALGVLALGATALLRRRR